MPAYLLGLFGGFPIGAYAAVSVLDASLCDDAAAHRSAILSNNASVAFLLSTATLFQSRSAPVILLVSQTAATLFVSLFGKKTKTEAPALPPLALSYTTLAADAISKAALAMLSLSAFAVFFAVLAKALTLAGLPAFFLLLLEPVSAVGFAASLLSTLGLPLSLSLAAFSLGFSGFSVILQTQALFQGKLPLKPQLFFRAAIGLLSFGLAFLLSTLCFGG